MNVSIPKEIWDRIIRIAEDVIAIELRRPEIESLRKQIVETQENIGKITVFKIKEANMPTTKKTKKTARKGSKKTAKRGAKTKKK